MTAPQLVERRTFNSAALVAQTKAVAARTMSDADILFMPVDYIILNSYDTGVSQLLVIVEERHTGVRKISVADYSHELLELMEYEGLKLLAP